jgi:hypothetical protein
MTDVTVKIMVEVLSILGIVTKEIGQRRMGTSFHDNISTITDLPVEKYLEELVGRKDVENAFQRLNKLTQEVARMAAAEALKITHGIDNKVINDKIQGVDHKVGSVIQGKLYLHQPSPDFVLSLLLG